MPHPASATTRPPCGAPPLCGVIAPLHSSTVTATESAPQPFRDAVESMHAAHVRAEISLSDIRPPQKLAPFSHAVGLEVLHPETDMVPETSEGDAFGRLILLHDPRADDTWDGTMRLVAYIQADMDADVASDPLLPQVAWQWLTEGFEDCGAGYSNLGGTVTTTNSVRYGEIGGPPEAFQLEMRASWTASGDDLSPHVEAFSRVLANVAGLPPEGVAQLGR
ncbi:DUF3000 domain-containing protein [Corynebacterium xerosis]|uniref:DUF3000 domain-containing protein n=1 Tax=Corynebacterium xerosis TaxID=1725 RepID=A0A2N6T1S1_9CORY|nr:DUF3000 domain-containing protein [Corynebacterium xerosis]NMF08248.1 DUF3000 domain-containing protein [Corynebacterium xerosis]PMC63266.1 DUF3000 domain-containing protein [Corynebacterium xerosis]